MLAPVAVKVVLVPEQISVELAETPTFGSALTVAVTAVLVADKHPVVVLRDWA